MERRASRDDGAAALFIAMTMLLLFGVAALAIDLSGLRLDLRADRLASDLAATAGASALDPFDSTAGPREACETAKAYVLLNLQESAWDPSHEPDCTWIPATCDAATLPPDPPVSGDVGSYHVEIVYPVRDDDPLMAERPVEASVDGAPCQRIGVSIHRNRDYTFARVLGFDQGATEVRSVARYGAGPGLGEVVPLVVLEPHDCSGLYTSGQGKVTVKNYLGPPGTDTPGLIVVDSDATTCSPSDPFVIDAKGTQKGWIRALPVPGAPGVPEIPSAILSFALYGVGSANAYDPSDLTDPINPSDLNDPTEPAKTWFRLYPKPALIPSRVTRAPIDYRYNCKSGYPNYLSDVVIPECDDADGTNDYIDQLVNQFEGQPLNPTPSGFNVWTDILLPTDPNYDANYPAGFPCGLQGSDPAISVSGNWYVDCPGTAGNQGFALSNTVTFSGGDVVFEGQVRTVSGGNLGINDGGTASGENHVMFVRHGDLIKDAQSSISLEYTMVYLADGRIDFNGGSGGLLWTAPDLPDPKPASLSFQDHFEDLALWSESPLRHRIGGQAGNDLEGTFFTPLADPFELSGQGTQVQFEAQFVTRRLELAGQSEVQMVPNPDRFTPIPLRQIMLIR